MEEQNRLFTPMQVYVLSPPLQLLSYYTDWLMCSPTHSCTVFHHGNAFAQLSEMQDRQNGSAGEHMLWIYSLLNFLLRTDKIYLPALRDDKKVAWLYLLYLKNCKKKKGKKGILVWNNVNISYKATIQCSVSTHDDLRYRLRPIPQVRSNKSVKPTFEFKRVKVKQLAVTKAQHINVVVMRR